MQANNQTVAISISVTTLQEWLTVPVRADLTTDQDRARFARPASLAARGLLRGLLSQAFGGAPSRWRWHALADGRPQVVDETGRTGPAISLSHSGDWVACAVADSPAIGIDIEAHRPDRDFPALIEAAFGPDERIEAAAGGIAGFYRLWTLREAIAKATGAGIPMAVDRIDRAAGGPAAGTWITETGGQTWQLTALAPAPGLSLGLAVALPPGGRAAAPVWREVSAGV